MSVTDCLFTQGQSGVLLRYAEDFSGGYGDAVGVCDGRGDGGRGVLTSVEFQLDFATAGGYRSGRCACSACNSQTWVEIVLVLDSNTFLHLTKLAWRIGTK